LIVAGQFDGRFCRRHAPSSSPSLFYVSIAWGLIFAGFSVASYVSIAWGLIVAGFSIASFWPLLSLESS
jgi:hypothetical protein